MALQADNKILVAGFTDHINGDDNFGVARYLSPNNTPTVSSFSKSGFEDIELAFTSADFAAKFNDFDNDALAKIKILSLPDSGHGVLNLNGSPVALDQEIQSHELENQTFLPAAEWSGAASFDWNGSDGIEYAAVGAAVNMDIAAVNDPPVISDISKIGKQDTQLHFKSADFTRSFSDKEDDSLVNIKILSLPANGSLSLNGKQVVGNQEIPIADIDNLVFAPVLGWSGETSFDWNGADGTDYADASAKVNIKISQNATWIYIPLVVDNPQN